ncbi:hypothetical protein LCGC14_2783230, partial [marine sediment metagenome]
MGIFQNITDDIAAGALKTNPRLGLARQQIETSKARQARDKAAEERYGRPAAPTPTKQPSLAELQNFKDIYGDDPELGPLINQAIQAALGGQAAAPAPVQPTSGATGPRAAPRGCAFSIKSTSRG